MEVPHLFSVEFWLELQRTFELFMIQGLLQDFPPKTYKMQNSREQKDGCWQD